MFPVRQFPSQQSSQLEKAMLTSSWYTPLPDDYKVIGISRGTPRRRPGGYRLYRALAPGSWFNSVDAEEFVRRYQSEILGNLDPQRVWDDLHQIADGKEPVLVCFEKPCTGSWCHRALVAGWFVNMLGMEVNEFGIPGNGTSHPLMPSL